MSNTTDQTTNEGSIFGAENYKFFFLGLVVIIIGFVLMAGGGSDDPNQFNTEAIYSPRRITIAPIVVLLGFVIEIYAVFRKPAS